MDTVDRAREAKNIYMREWRLKNKDRVKAAQQRYWEKKSREMQLKEVNK